MRYRFRVTQSHGSAYYDLLRWSPHTNWVWRRLGYGQWDRVGMYASVDAAEEAAKRTCGTRILSEFFVAENGEIGERVIHIDRALLRTTAADVLSNPPKFPTLK